MTTIYLIRHAEAEGNLYRRIHGQYDSRITELGMKQILALRERFSDISAHAVYASDLTRAHTTAQAIATPRDLPIQLDARLRESHMGHWEDDTWANVFQRDAVQLLAFSRDPEKWTSGEHFTAQIARMREVLLEIAEKHVGQTVCVVSHGNAIRALLSSVLGIPSARFSEIPHCDNTGVSLLHVADGDIRAEYTNDASHLDETTSTFARQNWWKHKSGLDDTNADFLPFDIHTRGEEYLTLRRAAWQEIHGSLDGFTDRYLEKAKEHAAAHPRALVEVTAGGQSIGLLELSPNRGAAEKEGAISFFYLKPEYRGQGFGPQLIGHAVSVYRPLGREKLTLFVAKVNEEAKSFYERFGFEVCGEQMGALDMLWKMELDIRVMVRKI